MGQLVVLNLGQGDWMQGCASVTAQLWLGDRATPMQITGRLPAAPEFGSLYPHWQRLYEALYAHRTWRRLRAAADEFELETDEDYVTDVSDVAFKQVCQELQQALNRWLNSDTFRNIDRQLRTRLLPSDEIRVIITAEHPQLLQLPWHLWQFFEDYPKAEPALSLPDFTRSIKTEEHATNGTVKILAILGNSQGINISRDRQLLEQLPSTELRLLVEPERDDLNQQLWQPGWDVLFFAGHSSSQRTGNRGQERGRIYLNSRESLTIAELKFALKKAIERGLKLAIFNSCDGLGLAWDLADLQIPQVIVMREPVPDRVAQEFLKHFLVAFSGGQSFYLSVREARERLQALEAEFQCATWLPVICQNPAELPPVWEEWVGRDEEDEGGGERGRGGDEGDEEIRHSAFDVRHSPLAPRSQSPISNRSTEHSRRSLQSSISNLQSSISILLLSSLVATSLVMVARSLGVLQPLELWAFDRLLQLRPKEAPDSRFLIVTVDESEIQAQTGQEGRGSISDQTLDRVLQELERHQPRVIGIDVYRDFAASDRYPALVAQLRQNQRLIAICKSSDATDDPTGIAPPPEVPEARVGFSDFLQDGDGVLRRHLLVHDPDPASPCTTPYAFNVRLAFQYLESMQVRPEFTSAGNLKLGNATFERLTEHTGGYQGIDAGGNQILLNYRSLPSPQAIAPQVSLTQVLQGKVRPESIQDRIVLIGVTASSSGDIWATPYGSGIANEVPGVVIQAQMTSQILSAVLDGRPLIRSWSWIGDGLWIGLWSLVGGVSMVWVATAPATRARSRWLRSGIGVVAIAILTGVSGVLLVHGYWIPLLPAGIAFVIAGGIASFRSRSIRRSQGG